MLLVCGAVLVAGLALQLATYGRGGHQSISDIPRLVLSRDIGPRHWPYLSRVLEYPVLAGVLLGGAVSIGSSPLGALVVTALAAGLVALLVTALLARRFGGRAWRWALASPLLLYAFQNWDLFAIAALVVGLLAFERGRDRAAGVAFGLGAAVKLFPLVVVPPLAARRWIDGDRRGARRLVASSLLTVVLANLPFVLADPWRWSWAYRFQSARQATWGSVWFYGLRIASVPVHGAAGALTANTASALALTASIVWLVVCTARRHLDGFAAAGAAVTLFVLCNKVYSPTYDLWLVAFFVMIPLGRRLWVTFCLVDLAVFAIVYGYFDGPLGIGVVRSVLPALVVLRTAVLVTVVARAVESHTRARVEVPRLVTSR
jgi:uncharacterized membrane protein